MKTILITGANRGIGLEFARQLSLHHRVIATCRNPDAAHDLQKLAQQSSGLSVYPLDVLEDASIKSLSAQLAHYPIDWLINNAGIAGMSGVTVGNIERENFLQVLNTNCLSVLKVSEAFLPQLKASRDKLIICISSRMGSIAENEEGRSYAYRASKAALNCAMRSFAIDVAPQGIQVLLLHPGWVQTSLGGPNGPTPPPVSVKNMLGVIDSCRKMSHAEVLHSYDGSLIPW